MLYVSKMARCCRLHKYSTITRCTRGLQSSTSQKKKLEGLLSQKEEFQDRHIGPREREQIKMLRTIGYQSLDELTQAAVPTKILHKKDLNIDEPLTEYELMKRIIQISEENEVWRSYIGMGYNNCCVPHTIMRNIFENPGWTTQYTPYQPEISQGRLEGLLNYQTMICDLTGMEVANASLLDEGTAAAEALTLACRYNRRKKVFVSDKAHPQTISVVATRATSLGLTLEIGDVFRVDTSTRDIAGILIQYPDTNGCIHDFTDIVQKAHANGVRVLSNINARENRNLRNETHLTDVYKCQNIILYITLISR